MMYIFYGYSYCVGIKSFEIFQQSFCITVFMYFVDQGPKTSSRGTMDDT